VGATASFAPSATIMPGATPNTDMLSIATTPHVATSGITSSVRMGAPEPSRCRSLGLLFSSW
jgi:hypothetical protein